MQVVGLAAVPVALFLVIAERRSWQPRTVSCDHVAGRIVFSPDGQMFATSRADKNEVQLRDVRSGALLRTLPTGRFSATLIAFRPDGILMSVQNFGSVRFWEPRTGKLLRTLERREIIETYWPILCADGRTLLDSQNRHGKWRGHFFRLWDTQTNTLRKLDKPRHLQVFAC
ncbi:MAG: WD40 repeat domain-containing protein, partial [Armatimonadota bacterium]|nr:WD40 repeat domain-containing protein [Armatimonadota bacterium]